MLTHRRFNQYGLKLVVAFLFIFPMVAATSGIAAASDGYQGAVYTMTNDATGNAIQVYLRANDGRLSPGEMFATGGLGTGSGLGSQGAIAIDQNRHLLFVVNAGSNDISVFSIQSHELVLVDRVPARGENPISLTVRNGLLFVLDAGGSGNIAGFRVTPAGQLVFLPGSVRFLSNLGSGSAPSPEQIELSPDGAHLVVTEKASNKIDLYDVRGVSVHGPFVTDSSGAAPYGFDFTHEGIAVVSEAASSTVSSYQVNRTSLQVISASIPDNQGAACWLVVSANGRFAYTANAASGTISAYQIDESGNLSLLDASGISGVTGAGSHPIDMAFSTGDGFLYVLASGNNSINVFAVNFDGSLSPVSSYTAPQASSGLVAQ